MNNQAETSRLRVVDKERAKSFLNYVGYLAERTENLHSDTYDTTSPQVVNKEIEDEPRYLPTAEDIENGYVPGSAAEAFRHAAAECQEEFGHS